MGVLSHTQPRTRLVALHKEKICGVFLFLLIIMFGACTGDLLILVNINKNCRRKDTGIVL